MAKVNVQEALNWAKSKYPIGSIAVYSPYNTNYDVPVKIVGYTSNAGIRVQEIEFTDVNTSNQEMTQVMDETKYKTKGSPKVFRPYYSDTFKDYNWKLDRYYLEEFKGVIQHLND